MEFDEWLAGEGLSPSTVKKYVAAINGPLTKWGIDHNLTSKPLYEVTDRDEFDAISELIEGTEVFGERNARGNHMYGAALNNYAKYLEKRRSFRPRTSSTVGPLAGRLNELEAVADEAAPFIPNNTNDARERVLRAIVHRRGQPKFRLNLITEYDGRCAITHCPVLPILEAAHVTPYLGPLTNAISNGLLLRADIHTLWDLGLVAIDPNSMTVSICPTLRDTSYQTLAGGTVFQPAAKSSRISHAALSQQWSVFQAHLAKGR